VLASVLAFVDRPDLYVDFDGLKKIDLFEKGILCFQADAYPDPTILFELLFEDLQVKSFHQFHDIGSGEIRKFQNVFTSYLAFHDGSIFECVACGCLVRRCQVAGSQFCATEIAHDHHEYIGEVVLAELAKDWIARGMWRFSIVKGAKSLARGAEHPGETMMPRVMKFLLQRFDMSADFLLTVYRITKSEEFAAFFLVDTFRGPLQRQV